MRKEIYAMITGMLLAVASAFAATLHAETQKENIRVMSYNIHRGGVVMLKQPLSQTAKAIQLAKADIVGIQEPVLPGVTPWRTLPSCSVGIMTWAKVPTF